MSNCRRIFGVTRQATGVLLGAMLLSTACSLTIDTEQVQCTSDLQCQQGPTAMTGATCIVGLCEIAERWQCLSGVPTLPPLQLSETPVALRLPVSGSDVPADVSAMDGTVEPTVEIFLCQASDALCDAPLQRQVVSYQEPIDFTVPGDFDGYVQLQSTGMMTVLYFLQPPYSEATVLPEVELMSDSMLDELMSDLQLIPGNSRGMVKLATRDCQGARAADVTFQLMGDESESDQSLGAFYDIQGEPSVLANSTDASGLGGFFNLPTGPTTVSATMGEAASPLGETGFLIRAGSITYASVGPSSLDAFSPNANAFPRLSNSEGFADDQ